MISIIGIGMGPHQLTAEAVAALRACDYVIASAKSEDDGLLAVRREICEAYGVELVVVTDPARDRDDPADYQAAVRDWHGARVDAYRQVIAERDGRAGFLVWGDPSLYDSTIRIVEQLTDDVEVIPGISAPQLLAARHRIVLHRVGEPVLITTARRLPEAIAAGHSNVVVFLTAALPEALAGLGDWKIWWGANLGTPSESLAAGVVRDVLPSILAARAAAKEAAGWVMDLYLLRAPA